MANYAPNTPYGGGYYPPQYPNQGHPPYMQMSQPQYLQQQQHRPQMYNTQMQSPNQHVYPLNTGAFQHNSQFHQHGVAQPNSAPPPPLPPPQFFPNGSFPQYPSNLPPPPFPPPPLPVTNQNYHSSMASNQIPGTSNPSPAQHHFQHFNRDALPNFGVNNNQPSPQALLNQEAYGGAVKNMTSSSVFGAKPTHTGDRPTEASNSKFTSAPVADTVTASHTLATQAPVKTASIDQRDQVVDAPNTNSGRQEIAREIEPVTEASNNLHIQQDLPQDNYNRQQKPPDATHMTMAPSAQNFKGLSSQTRARPSKEEIATRRAKAKEALLQLKEYDIGYVELAEEGLDMTFVQKFYTELGISTQSNASPSKNVDAMEITLEDTSATRAGPPQGSRIPGLPAVVTKENAVTATARSESSLEPGEISDEGSDLDVTVTTAHKETISDSPADPQGNEVEKSNKGKIVAPAPTKKTEDRKDYIARLLAAKQSVKKTTEKPTAVTAATTIDETTSNGETVSATTTPTLQGSTQPPAIVPLDAKKPEVKDSVQTQLIRQRLEALKNSSKIAKDSVKPNQQPPVPRDQGSNSQIGAGDTPLSTPADVINQGGHVPSSSFFASSGRHSFGALPGLSPAASAFPSGLYQPFQSVAPATSSDTAMIGEPLVADVGKDVSDLLHFSSPSMAMSSRTPTSRKRATAMDFIDSPPRNVRRRTGSNEPISLVIEVSDDEDRDEEDEVEFSGPLIHQQSFDMPNKNNKDTMASRSLPSLTNLPTSRGSATSTANTPPVAQTPNTLADTEEELKMLRQKILEAELRRKAKRAIAEKQLGSSTPKSSEARTQELIDELKDGKGEELGLANRQLVEQKESLGTLGAAVSAAEEQLHVEERNQALLVARAESERQGAAHATTAAEKQLRLERKSTLETALTKLESQIQAARSRLDAIRKQQAELEVELQKGTEDRDALNEELKALLAADVIPNDTILEESTERAPASNEANEFLEDHRENVSQTLVEQDLQSDRTDSPLEQDNNEVSDALHEVQGDVMDISSSSADEGQIISSHASLAGHSADLNQSEVPIQPHLEVNLSPIDDEDSYSPSESQDNLIEPHSLGSQDEDVSMEEEYQHDMSQPRGYTPDDDDIYNTASGELSDAYVDMYEPKGNDSPGGEEVYESQIGELATDDQETYEPQTEIPATVDNNVFEPSFAEDTMSEDEVYATKTDTVPAPAQAAGSPISISSSADGSDSSVSDSQKGPALVAEQSGTPQSAGMIESYAEEHSGSNDQYEDGELTEASPKDSDYEPPEPSVVVDNHAAELSADATEQTPSMTDIDNDAEAVESAHSLALDTTQEVPEQEQPGAAISIVPNQDVATYSRYTPYQSPLSQFASYRFHPEYVAKVPSGFRSLTFSHNIDHSKPLCKWELAGGLCNDSSCDFQHFRDLPMLGSKILISMISIREGKTLEEKSTYVAGLKKTVNDLSAKKINDVDSVASAIVAYRSKFLGDSSRILTNLEGGQES